MSVFKFELGAKVQLKMSKESGVVVGRAEYAKGEQYPAYYVRFVTAQGRQATDWFVDAEIELAE